MNGYMVEELNWVEQAIGILDLPFKRLPLVWGFGSGLSRRASDPPGRVWAVGDRGPNLHVGVAVQDYGVAAAAAHAQTDGAKVMPWLAAGPALAELQVTDHGVELVRIVPLRGEDGQAISGLPTPGSTQARLEPAVDLAGRLIAPDPSGVDSEGVVALADGGFLVGDEYGPSLLRLDRHARVIERWAPEGHAASYVGARYPVVGRLPAIAARRRLNRGIEALAPMDDGGVIVAFQSPLANPDSAASKAADHVRFWQLAADGRFVGEHLYRLEPVESFRRDPGATSGDRKVSELTTLGGDALLVLERVSASTKLFRVELNRSATAPNEGQPTLEQRSAAGEALPSLTKALLLDTDHHAEIGADLEGVALISPHELLLVNDNDFGVEGARTRFWRVRFDRPIV